MADIIYTVNQDSPESIIGFEQYSQEDRALVDSFQINSTFNPTRDYCELHILTLSDELLESTYDYRGYKQALAAQSAGQAGTSAVTIDPIEDSKAYGYGEGGVKLLYHFLSDLYSQDKSKINFYIQDISADRTEISLSTLILSSEEVLTLTSAIKNKIQGQSYFEGFRLNFQQNDLFIGINIDTLSSPTGTTVVVKLYEPLPDTYGIKSTLNIVEVVSDSVAYEVETEIVTPETIAPTLRSPNFNIDIVDDNVIPTNYYSYDELLSYPVNNSNSQIYSTVNEKSIDISIDHSDFSNFIHFSSAQERLLNFKYKLDLITDYSASLAERSAATTGLQGISGSNKYYEGLITGIVSNFDHYERFLYYESGSSSWPKVNDTKPYVNEQSYIPGTLTPNSVVSTWYSNEIANAISYDNTNYNSLAYSIPTYLRDDANNENYLTFIYMIGQHFDNLWLYSKAVTDKYDADNRLDKGISKDLVAEALKNFGVKLYTSNKSVEDLFGTFIGQAYQSGSENISNYITGSLTGSNTPIQPSSVDDYQKEVYKRIYHNLPLLLKSKGTERGLRALINCFGIPSDIFDIKVYGGRNVNERPFYGDYKYYTSSLDKVRLDNTGSIVTGSTLSQYTSIVNREYKYTDDLHSIELGFSPTDNVDNYIISKSLSTGSLSSFNIDEYLGDPRNLYLDNYYTLSPQGNISGSLELLTNEIMSGSNAYNVQDFVRLIKFFDNTIFKMVKDFIPARSTADTGIIIKPHLLQRNKAKSVILSGSRPEYTGSIDTAFAEGNSGGSFSSKVSYYNTSYTDITQTPDGLSGPFTEPGININILPRDSHAHEEARFNGELENSEIQVTNGELNRDNIYKAIETVSYPYNINFVSSSNEICLLNTAPGVSSLIYITSSTATLASTDFFIYTNASSQYTASIPKTGGTPTLITFPTSIQQLQATFPSLTQYSTGSIKVNNTDYSLGDCTSSVDFIYATCSIWLTAEGQNINNVIISPYPNPGDIQPTILTNWFNCHEDQTNDISNLKFEITVGATTTTIPNPAQYQFNPSFLNQSATITVSDPKAGPGCKVSKTVSVGNCNIGSISTGSEGLVFTYSTVPVHTAFINQDIGESSDSAYYYQGSSLGFPSTVSYGSGGTLRYIEQRFPGTGGYQYRGLQSYFTPYPPDPGTKYSVFFLRRAGSIWSAETVIANVTNTEVTAFNVENGILLPPQDSGNISNATGANPPIKIITPYSNRLTYNVDAYGNITNSTYSLLGPDEIVRVIVVRATLPNGGCTKQVTLYPNGVTSGTAYFTPVDVPIDWPSALLGTPTSGVDFLYGVPIRSFH